MSISPRSTPKVVAQRVAAFDLGSEKGVSFTDGEALFRMTVGEAPKKLAVLPYVTDLAAL